MREIRVAIAIEPVEATMSEFDCSWFASVVESAEESPEAVAVAVAAFAGDGDADSVIASAAVSAFALWPDTRVRSGAASAGWDSAVGRAAGTGAGGAGRRMRPRSPDLCAS